MKKVLGQSDVSGQRPKTISQEQCVSQKNIMHHLEAYDIPLIKFVPLPMKVCIEIVFKYWKYGEDSIF